MLPATELSLPSHSYYNSSIELLLELELAAAAVAIEEAVSLPPLPPLPPPRLLSLPAAALVALAEVETSAIVAAAAVGPAVKGLFTVSFIGV